VSKSGVEAEMKAIRAIATALLVLFTLGVSDTLAATPEEEAVRSGSAVKLGSSDPIRLELRYAQLQTPSFRQDSPRLYWLPEQAPEGLSLEVPLHDVFAVFLSADLDAELPRLDSIDGETYFSVGARTQLSATVALFVEDFISASAVIGSDVDLEVEPVAERSWDGHQIAAGVLITPTEQITIRGEAIGYVLSESKRHDGLGATVLIAFAF
jgi:hypothetical protein